MITQSWSRQIKRRSKHLKNGAKSNEMNGYSDRIVRVHLSIFLHLRSKKNAA
jgi:hypothetical protein